MAANLETRAATAIDALNAGRWGDDDDGAAAPAPAAPTTGDVDAVAASLASQKVSAVETMKTAEGETIQVERASGDTSELVAARSWEDLNLDPSLLKGVYLANFAKPFKIQEAALPLILSGFRKAPVRENLLAQAKSGSGKTAAFVLGMLENVDVRSPATQALCVCPTRELAQQNAAVTRTIGKVLIEEKGLVVALALSDNAGKGAGGRGRGRAPKEPVVGHIVVGTPGRTLQLIKTRQLKTQGITMLVLDEADEMDTRGHRDDTRSLRKALPDPVPNSNLQRDFNVSVFESFDASSSTLLRELDEGDRFVQKSAESTSM